MKLKRSLSILLTLTVVLSTLTFAIPTYAEDSEESFIDYIFCDDFSTTGKLGTYLTGYNPTSNIWDSATNAFTDSSLFSISEGALKLTGNKTTIRVGFQTPTITGTIPKLVVSLSLKLNFSSSSGYAFGTRDGYGSGTLTLVDTGYIYTDTKKGTEIDATYSTGEWMNITLVYDNDSTKNNNRDIYINGTCYGPYVSTSTGWNYAQNGYVLFLPQFYSKSGDSVLFDNIEVYAYPTELKYEVASASGKEVKLNFNMIPNASSVTAENFTLSQGSSNLNISSAKISTSNPKQVVLTLEESLQPGTSYSVTASGINAGALTGKVSNYLAITSKKVDFETSPLKIYAENLKLYDEDTEVTSLADGTYTVKTNFVNESSETLTPVIAAGLYDENNELKNLQLIPVSDATLPIEEDITLANTSGLTLKLFMLKSKTSPETVSDVSVYTASSKDTSTTFDPEIKMLKDTFNIETLVNGDTQVITTKVDGFTNEMARPATLIVLKKGKGLSDIDVQNPMATIVACDSVNLSESGISYKIADVKDDYEAYIYLKNSDNYGYKTFTYYGKAFIDSGKDIVKDITASEVDTFITDYKDAINLDTSVYDTLKDGTGSVGEVNEKGLVAASIEAQREEKDTKEFASFEEFMEAYNTALELVLAKTDADVKKIIDKLPVSDVTSLYKDTISEDAVSAVYTELIANKPLTMTDFEDAFNKNVILKGIQKSENYTQTQTIIENTTALTGIDLTVYNTLNETKPVIEAVDKKSYATYELLKGDFDLAVTNQKTSENNVIILPPNTQSPSVSVGGGGGGTAVIPSPMEKTEISANPEPTVEPIIPATGFNDLSGFDWAKDAINNLYNKGIVSGVSQSSYNPAGEVKREEFVKMIDTLYSSDSTVSSFIDVNQSEWYASYINKAVSAGIIKGMNENTFGLGYGVTREDMAVIIVRVLKLETNTSGETFSDDSNIADYAKEAVYTLKNKGIISGTGNGNYEPKRVMTRAEAAVLINNILNIVD